MNRLRVTRSIDAPVDRVWAILGNPGEAPHPSIGVEVERRGSPDGTGLIRTVKVGFGRVREEITQVGPGPRLEYRLLGGAPVRDYSARVDLGATPTGTVVSWDVGFRPAVPGTGWAISLATRRTLNRMLDAVAERAGRP